MEILVLLCQVMLAVWPVCKSVEERQISALSGYSVVAGLL